MSLLKTYMEAVKKHEYDAKEHQTRLEADDDKYSKEPIIPTPAGFKWISLAGGFYAYEKVLKNGKVIRLAGGEGNSRLRIYEKNDKEFDNNTAMLFKNEEDAESGGTDPEDMKRFFNEKELKAILSKWGK